MQLTDQDIKKIASLARIQVDEKDIAGLREDLQRILGLMKTMSEANTENVAPLAHAFEASQPLRDDVITAKNEREEFQKIAPQTKAGLYIVPAVMDAE